MTRRFDLLIVGAGHGGAQCAIALRQGGYGGIIGIAGEEPDSPYERPPLSKEYLAGEKSVERLQIRPPDFWTKRNITLMTSTRIARIDADAHVAATEDGERIRYRQLVWAAGGRPRPLPIEGAGLSGVHMLRTRADADTIRTKLPQVERVAVIGGGYIGLEAAAVLATGGKQVSLFESQPRLLARVAAEPVSGFMKALHTAHGVDINLNASISAIVGRAGRACGVLLGSGATIPADLVLVGIGLLPNQAVMAEAGAKCRDGVIVDAFCRTGLPDIYAIGDCASHPNPFAGSKLVRIESVQNASDQARTAAAAILGRPEPYATVPWFWSNQYEVRLQTAGLAHDFDTTVVRGDPDQGRFSLAYLRAGRIVAIDCINSVADFAAGKLLIAERTTPDLRLFADPGVPLKSLLGR